MSAKSPDDRALVASIAAHESWAATENRTARTAPARTAFEQKFLDAADGDPVRAAHLRAAHFKRLALKSAQSRRNARELTQTAEPSASRCLSPPGATAAAPPAPRATQTGGGPSGEAA